MSAHPRGLDLNLDSIDIDEVREPLVLLHDSGDLLVKPAASDYWVRINAYGEIKWLRPDSVANSRLMNGEWMTRVGGVS